MIFILRNFDSKSWHKSYIFSLNWVGWKKPIRFGFHGWSSVFSQNFPAITPLPAPWSQPWWHMRITWGAFEKYRCSGLPPRPIKLESLGVRPGIMDSEASWVILTSGSCWKLLSVQKEGIFLPVQFHALCWHTFTCEVPSYPFRSSPYVLITPVLQDPVQMPSILLTCFWSIGSK